MSASMLNDILQNTPAITPGHVPYDHSGENLTDAQKHARAVQRLQAFIEAGKQNAPKAVAKILSETPADRLIRDAAATVRPEDDGSFRLAAGGEGHIMAEHALRQLADRAGFPGRYLSELRSSEWGRALVATNINELLRNGDQKSKMLVRVVGDRVRGVLSQSYRPEDSRPAVDALLGVARDTGAIVAEATALDHKVSVKLLVPELVEIFPGEWVVVGLDFRTGDYGGVAREICGFILRLSCLNGATTTSQYRRVHLGAKIQDEVEYSKRTKALNEEASASAARDIGMSLVSPESVKGMVARVRAANEAALDPAAAIASLKKRVNKAEQEAIVGKYNSPDVELLPAGNTAWRFSNAISWLANQEDVTAERKLDLQQLAGEVIDQAALTHGQAR